MKQIFLSFLLVVTLSYSYGQGLVQIQEMPLLISPSFTGSDTSLRLCMASQQFGNTTDVYERTRQFDNSAFFASVDKMDKDKRRAFGFYASYQKYTLSENFEFGKEMLRRTLTPFNEYLIDIGLKSSKSEVGISFVPKSFQINKEKKYLLVPALLANYSYNTAEEHHRSNYEFSDTVYYQNHPDADPSAYNYLDNNKDTTWGFKNSYFHRIGVHGSIMFKSRQLFMVYQIGFVTDFVTTTYSDYSYSQMYPYDTYSYNQHLTTLQVKSSNDQGKRNATYLNVFQSFTLGVKLPRRDNSLMQLSGMASVSFNKNPVQGSYNSLIYRSNHYYDNSNRYDYQNIYNSSGRRIGATLRIWRILIGGNGGLDSPFRETGVFNYHIGYKAKAYTVTFGIINSRIFNVSVRVLFK